MLKVFILRRSCAELANTTAVQGLQSLFKRTLSISHNLLQEQTPPPESSTPPPPPAAAEAAEAETVVEEEKGKETIGFIGLGNMGRHMAINLIKHGGYNLVVYDVYPDAMEPLKNFGATAVTTPGKVAQQVSKIITMLPSSPDVNEVYCGENGILSGLMPGTLCMDSSTIDPSVSKEMSQLCSAKDGVYMDSPVSGGVVAARDANLTFMCGGTEGDYANAEAVLKHMAKNVVHCGGVGTGQAAKICNNMLLAISMIGTSEVMNLGQQLGLDKKMLAHILNISTGRCWSSELYNPCPGVVDGVPSSNDYQGGFGTQLMAKDLGLAQNASTATKSATPLGSLAHQIYRLMCNRGYSKLDFSSVYQFLREGEKK